MDCSQEMLGSGSDKLQLALGDTGLEEAWRQRFQDLRRYMQDRTGPVRDFYDDLMGELADRRFLRDLVAAAYGDKVPSDSSVEQLAAWLGRVAGTCHEAGGLSAAFSTTPFATGSIRVGTAAECDRNLSIEERLEFDLKDQSASGTSDMEDKAATVGKMVTDKARAREALSSTPSTVLLTNTAPQMPSMDAVGDKLGTAKQQAGESAKAAAGGTAEPIRTALSGLFGAAKQQEEQMAGQVYDQVTATAEDAYETSADKVQQAAGATRRATEAAAEQAAGAAGAAYDRATGATVQVSERAAEAAAETAARARSAAQQGAETASAKAAEAGTYARGAGKEAGAQAAGKASEAAAAAKQQAGEMAAAAGHRAREVGAQAERRAVDAAEEAPGFLHSVGEKVAEAFQSLKEGTGAFMRDVSNAEFCGLLPQYEPLPLAPAGPGGGTGGGGEDHSRRGADGRALGVMGHIVNFAWRLLLMQAQPTTEKTKQKLEESRTNRRIKSLLKSLLYISRSHCCILSRGARESQIVHQQTTPCCIQAMRASNSQLPCQISYACNIYRCFATRGRYSAAKRRG